MLRRVNKQRRNEKFSEKYRPCLSSSPCVNWRLQLSGRRRKIPKQVPLPSIPNFKHCFETDNSRSRPYTHLEKANKNGEPGHIMPVLYDLIESMDASQTFADNFTSIFLQPVLISEHQSIQSQLKCNLDLPCRKKSSTKLWKLNTLLLSRKKFFSIK
jgi:hypothetical protein